MPFFYDLFHYDLFPYYGIIRAEACFARWTDEFPYFLGTKFGLWSIAFNKRIWALAFFKVVHRDNVRFFPLAFFTE